MKKAWNPTWIAVIAFFFTLLPGLILMAINYEKLGKPKYKKPLIIFAIISFLLLCYFTAVLSSNYDYLFAIIHLSTPILIIVFQRKLYDDFLDSHESHQTESLRFPAILSFLFIAVFILSLSGYKYFEHLSIKNGVAAAEQFFLDGQFNEAKITLHLLMEKYPEEPIILYNLAAIYRAEHQNDSAKFYLRKLLETSPNHSEAKEVLYNLEYEQYK